MKNLRTKIAKSLIIIFLIVNTFECYADNSIKNTVIDNNVKEDIIDEENDSKNIDFNNEEKIKDSIFINKEVEKKVVENDEVISEENIDGEIEEEEAEELDDKEIEKNEEKNRNEELDIENNEPELQYDIIDNKENKENDGIDEIDGIDEKSVIENEIKDLLSSASNIDIKDDFDETNLEVEIDNNLDNEKLFGASGVEHILKKDWIKSYNINKGNTD